MRKIVIIVVLMFVPWSIATAQIPQIERDALIALYNSTNGPNWTNNTNWLGAVGTECTWNGVGCSGGHVSLLFLQSNGLTGSIPPEFWDLTSLVLVYLDSNSVSGSIPPQVENLTSLQDLRLGSNELSGSIPPELGNLTSLAVLFLSSNELSGSIPPELEDLSSLRVLGLSDNQLSGGIPPELGDLPSLENLYLNNNQLNGSIPPELGNLSNLIYLQLDINQLSGGIPAELGNLSSLLDLRLHDNQLTDTIPPELGDLASLTFLSLSSNRLRGSIPSELGNLANLNTLLLERNLLSGVIPPELGLLSTLQYLSLDVNSLGGSIPPELGDLSSLEYLRLNGTQLSGSIPLELVNLSALQDGSGLDLRFNALHSDDAALIAFLNQKQISGDWQSSQTIAPENLIVDWVGDHTVWLRWDAVSYQSNQGGYEAFVAPVASGQWVSAGMTAAKTELEIPVTGLDAGGSYDLAVASYTLPHVFNPNTVTSDLGESVMSTTAATGCAAPVIDITWGNPTTLSLTSGYDSYFWNTGETSPTIGVDPNDPRFYWVTVTSPGPCQESAIVLVDPLLFSDGFESGDLGQWSLAVP